MKKITVILLAALTAASLCACGSGNSNTSKADNKKSGNETETKTDKSGQSDQEEESSGESKKKYSEYEDLSSFESIYYGEEDDEEPYSVYISTPAWRSQNEYGNSDMGTSGNKGYTIFDNPDYSIIIAYDKEETYSGDIEDVLTVTFPGFIDIIGSATSDYYEGALLPENIVDCIDSQEIVELDCGEKAAKFSGTIPEVSCESYTIKPVDVYGYSFVYNEDINITVGFEIQDQTKISEYEDKLTDIVDRMVKTIRTEQ